MEYDAKIMLVLTPDEAKALAMAWAVFIGIGFNHKRLLIKATEWAIQNREHPVINNLCDKLSKTLVESMSDEETEQSEIKLSKPKRNLWN